LLGLLFGNEDGGFVLYDTISTELNRQKKSKIQYVIILRFVFEAEHGIYYMS
jgi:hypothetical protein